MRYDAVLEEWVIDGAHRQDRTYLPPADQCPLCPSAGGRQTEIPAHDYDVVVFENRFPSFAPAHRWTCRRVLATCRSALRHAAGRRAAARWCASPADHDASFADAGAGAGPTGESRPGPTAPPSCRALTGVEQVFCFENRGEEIGVTPHHPHGQIYAYPFVTPRTRRDAARPPAPPRAYRRQPVRRPRSRAEQADGSRVVIARASTGRRSCRSPPAGRSRCTSSRTGRCPTCRR